MLKEIIQDNKQIFKRDNNIVRMFKIFKIIESKGGIKLFKQWLLQGVLPLAIAEFILLGKSRKSLELLREILSFKHTAKLRRRYSSTIANLPKYCNEGHKANKQIWVLWWQGMENAPILVKKCYDSIRNTFIDWNITILSQETWMDYVKMPDFIIEKFKKGIIPIAQFSDLLRLQLLIEEGGMWMDATIYVSNDYAIPQPIVNYSDTELFMYQREEGGYSNWLILAKSNNEILRATRDLLFDYWRKNNYLTDYFIFHRFFDIVCDIYANQAHKIYFYSNTVPHVLLLHLFDEYDDIFWRDLNQLSAIHKLSYKFDPQKTIKKGTYYEKLFNT